VVEEGPAHVEDDDLEARKLSNDVLEQERVAELDAKRGRKAPLRIGTVESRVERHGDAPALADVVIRKEGRLVEPKTRIRQRELAHGTPPAGFDLLLEPLRLRDVVRRCEVRTKRREETLRVGVHPFEDAGVVTTDKAETNPALVHVPNRLGKGDLSVLRLLADVGRVSAKREPRRGETGERLVPARGVRVELEVEDVVRLGCVRHSTILIRSKR
jgi:hypothetical protein